MKVSAKNVEEDFEKLLELIQKTGELEDQIGSSVDKATDLKIIAPPVNRLLNQMTIIAFANLRSYLGITSKTSYNDLEVEDLFSPKGEAQYANAKSYIVFLVKALNNYHSNLIELPTLMVIKEEDQRKTHVEAIKELIDYLDQLNKTLQKIRSMFSPKLLNRLMRLIGF